MHVASTNQRGFVHENYAIAGGLLHFLILQEPGYSVGFRKPCFAAKHLATGLCRLRDGNHRATGLSQCLANLLFECRLAGSGDAANDHNAIP